MNDKINNEATVYMTGNPWQKKVYAHMADFLQAIPEIETFGQSSKGTRYKHLLTEEQCHFNFINDKILVDTVKRFAKHKAGDLNRVLTNTAASQPYCFNLIIYLQQHSQLADKLFSNLLDKQIKIHHIEPEFTPNLCDSVVGFERTSDESIGDQNLKLGIGTDADIAVFYSYENNKKGVLLVEFKFIEAEFSVCSSIADKKEIQTTCNSEMFFSEMVDAKNLLCGYNKYFNWELTAKSKVIDGEKIKKSVACPFRFGLNQLWRNMLLVEQVASARNCNEFGFFVFSPSENNKYLWSEGKTESLFREILTEKGNKNFKSVTLESILDQLQSFVADEEDKKWLAKMNTKYRIK